MRKRLRLILYMLGSLLLLLLFVVWLLPPEGKVVRSVTIYAPRSEVFSKLTHLKTYPKWFPWIQSNADSDLSIIYYGEDKKTLKGFSYENDQNGRSGFGHYELGKIDGDSLINFIFEFKDMPQISGSYTLHKKDSNTILVWEVEMRAGWKPWWRFFASMMNKMTSPVLDTGLNKLKRLCES